MAWTDIFPVLTEDHVDEFKASAARGEKEELNRWFNVKQVYPPKDGPVHGTHLVATTLFWKNISSSDPEIPRPSRFRMVHANRLGLVKRNDPWVTYVEPFLRFSEKIRAENPEVSLRVYLASDLEFLIPDLTSEGWEVHLMETPSIRSAPGVFWRFLALEEKGRFVTIIDADRISKVNSEVARTRLIERTGLGIWRVPGYYNADSSIGVRYRPILGGHFGAKGGIRIKPLIYSYIWHLRRGSLQTIVDVPACGPKPLCFAEWPSYGVEEVFLLMAIYPRLAQTGMLTFIPSDARSLFLPIDIEYTTWASRKSELVYFPAIVACC